MATREPPFSFIGHVTDLKRSLDKIVMQLETAEGEKHLELPVTVKNDFELIPYQTALLDRKVRYRTDTLTSEKEFGKAPAEVLKVSYTLNILSGPLQGNSYKATGAK